MYTQRLLYDALTVHFCCFSNSKVCFWIGKLLEVVDIFTNMLMLTDNLLLILLVIVSNNELYFLYSLCVNDIHVYAIITTCWVSSLKRPWSLLYKKISARIWCRVQYLGTCTKTLGGLMLVRYWFLIIGASAGFFLLRTSTGSLARIPAQDILLEHQCGRLC